MQQAIDELTDRCRSLRDENKKLDAEFAKLHQFLMSLTVDNANSAKRVGRGLKIY